MFVASAIIFTIGIGFLNRWLLMKANHKIWEKNFLKIIAQLLPYIIFIFALLWWWGSEQNIPWLRTTGASVTSIALILNLYLVISLPFSLVTELLFKTTAKRKKTNNSWDPSRRLFLKTSAAFVPALALTGTVSGFASSFSQIRFPQIKIAYKNLPAALNGLKILHLSDLHLGYYFNLNTLEQTLTDAEKYNADIVLVTGDIADDLSMMTGAMKLIDQLQTPYDKFVSVGNHEYFRGIKQSIKNIEAGPVPLLLNSHHTMAVKGAKIIIGGADDPVRMRSNINGFLDNAISRTFANEANADFKILMSHRPKALDLAKKYNIDLTLSGHTHGGQVGLAGRSFWEIFNENSYLWGLYTKGDAGLYTSAGMGHWFPYRLNCPLEAPVITLVKATV